MKENLRRIVPTLILGLAVGLGIAAPARAQSQATTGEVGGRVVDAQGAVVPGVTVTVKSPNTGLQRTAVTDQEGLFSIALLPPDSYELLFELSGFAVVTRPLRITVGSSLTANQTMQVSSVAETVTVTASPAVESTATVRTTTVDAEAIANLPINGRRFQDFITLTPTVQVDPQRGQLSFAGQRGINSNVSIDGADYNQPFFGGIRGGERSNNAFTVPQESVQEFQVVAAGYSAEFGRSTGGLVNAITKSGTNSLRGSVFYVNRNRDWAEKNAFGQNAAPTQQQYGGSIGGPIAKNRLFYFGAAESQNFENTRAVVFNLTGIARTADNAEAYDYYRSLETPFETTNDALALLGRMDYQLHRLRPVEPALQLQRQRREERQRDRQRPGGHDGERAFEQRHGKGQNQHLRRPVHGGDPLERAARHARPVFEGAPAARRQRADPTRDQCRR